MAARLTPKDARNDSTETSLVFSLFAETDRLHVRTAIADGRLRGSGLRRLRIDLDLTIDELARLLDVAARTINRKEKDDQPLTISEGDRAFRIARTADLATTLIGDRAKALSWLHATNTYLGGRTPLAMLDTEIGADLVAESLYAIAYGAVA